MRLGTGIGLIALLLGVALMLYLFAGPTGPGGSSYGGTLATKNTELREEANRLGGRDAQGQRMSETLTLTPWPARGTLRGVEVATLDPQGVAASHFGLAVGDVVTHVGPLDVGGAIISDAAVAADMLDDAFARGMTLTVQRDGQTLELPAGGATQATPAAGTVPGLGGLLPGTTP